MSIASEISRLLTIKADLKTAIEAKGVSVGAVKLDGYPDKINEIYIGNSNVSGSGYLAIRFYDYEGTLLWTHKFESGYSLTSFPLPNPDRTSENLSFQNWNHTLSELQNLTTDVQVGAIYRPTDGLTHLFVSATTAEVTMYLNKSNATDTITVYWGDGTSDSDSSVKAVMLLHTYAIEGDYEIIIEIAGTGTYSLLSQKANGSFMLGIVINKAVLGIKCDLNTCSFRGLGLREVIIPNHIVRLFSQAFDGCNLSHVNIPKLTYIDASMFLSNLSLRNIVYNRLIPNGSYYTANMYSMLISYAPAGGMYNLETAYALPSTGYFSNLKEIILSQTVPPTLASASIFRGASLKLIIYVPDANVNDYKTATNWVKVASIIKPISQRIL